MRETHARCVRLGRSETDLYVTMFCILFCTYDDDYYYFFSFFLFWYPRYHMIPMDFYRKIKDGHVTPCGHRLENNHAAKLH